MLSDLVACWQVLVEVVFSVEGRSALDIRV